MAVGSVEPLPSGSFRAVVRAGVDPITRKRVKITETWSTEAEARAACERLSAQVEADTVPDRAATVEVLLRRWMGVADHELTTRETTEGYVRRTILPAFGPMPLRKIQHRVDLLDRLYTHLRRCNALCDGRRKDAHVCKPMSAGAVRRLHGILSTAFNYGISWGWMERNPAEHAHPPKLTRRRARPPEPEQIARLLNTAMGADLELGVFLWLAVTTGARRGELTGLRWSRVDEDRAELLFDVNYVVRSGQRQLKTTKSDEDRRIAMDRLSVDMLRGLRLARQEALKPVRLTLGADGFVFTPDPLAERPWHPDHWTHAYRKVADVVGIEQPLKNLRHFNATQLLAAGVDLRTTAGRLGHSDGGATTLRFYADRTPAADRQAVDNLAHDVELLRQKLQVDVAPSNVALSLRGPSRPIQEVLGAAVPVSTYRDIAAALSAAVRDGRLAQGEQAPTATSLAAHFSVAWATAQRAVTALAAGGLISKSGSRWLVTAPDGVNESDVEVDTA